MIRSLQWLRGLQAIDAKRANAAPVDHPLSADHTSRSEFKLLCDHCPQTKQESTVRGMTKRISEQRQQMTFKNLACSPVFRSERECLLRAKL